MPALEEETRNVRSPTLGVQNYRASHAGTFSKQCEVWTTLGQNFYVTGTHGKVYHPWKFPDVTLSAICSEEESLFSYFEYIV